MARNVRPRIPLARKCSRREHPTHEWIEKFRREADERGITVEQLMREAIEQKFDELDDE